MKSKGAIGSTLKSLGHVSALMAGMSLAAGSQAGSASAQIEYEEDSTYEAFARDHLYPSRPVVIRNVVSKWNAVKRWSPEFFKRQFGDMTFTINDSEYGQPGYDPSRTTTFSMAEYIDRVLESTPANPAPYFRNRDLFRLFPSLRPDVEPLPDYLLPNWLGDRYLVKRVGEVLNRGAVIELYIGGAGGAFPVLHYDGAGTHAFLMQIYGRKKYYVYPPDQEPYLYPSPEKPNLSLLNDVESPDLERFPLFVKARPITFILEPGELLFVPSHWWHTVKMLTPSITVSANVLNESNWHELVKFVAVRQSNPALSLASRIYLGAAGARRAWRDREWRKRDPKFSS